MEVWDLFWKCILLGTVQGLTEFLPVSSSGHLLLLERVLGFSLGAGDLTFVNILLHFGTLIAVAVCFRREILALFHRPWKPLCMLAVATVPAGLVGLLLEDGIDALFTGERGLLCLALCFGATAMLLLAAESASKRKTVRAFGWRASIPMGLMQAVAVLPGISRSGSTIAIGTLAGARAEDASTFSFLMSIPVILGGALVGLFKAVVLEPQTISAIGVGGIAGMVAGIAVSAVCGTVAIKVMMKAVKRADYKWFALYLLLLSLTTLWLDVVL